MPTTTGGLPYPAASDPVAQGAAAIQSLATTVDTQLAAKLSAAAASSTYARVVPATVLTDAGIAAAAVTAGVGGRVFLLPGETYVLSAPVTLDRVGLIGDGSPTLSVPVDLGAGVAALTFTSPGEGDDNSIPIEGFTLIGSGVRSLGVKTANGDGIAITGFAKPILRDVRVRQFGSGIVWNNSVGHIYHQHIEVTDCFYGIYCKNNSYDYFVTDSRIDGNTFANFATPANQGFAAMVLTNVHMGFAPYGIYQEPTPAAQGSTGVFLQEVILRHARMEAIGNAAILSDATEDGTNHSSTSNLLIEHPGFSWSATYKIAARDKNYAVVLPFTQRRIRIEGGAYPFTAGTLNVYRIKLAAHASFELAHLAAATSLFTVDSGGTASVFAYQTPVVTGASPSFAQVDVTSGSGYYRWGDNNNRIGTDGNQLLLDSPAGWKSRDSNSGFAVRGELNDTQFFVSASHTVRTGRAATGSRPSASTAGAGAMFYDTTLSKPIWSDGTTWRDAAGTAV